MVLDNVFVTPMTAFTWRKDSVPRKGLFPKRLACVQEIFRIYLQGYHVLITSVIPNGHFGSI